MLTTSQYFNCDWFVAGADPDCVLWDEEEGFRRHVHSPCLHHSSDSGVVLLQVTKIMDVANSKSNKQHCYCNHLNRNFTLYHFHRHAHNIGHCWHSPMPSSWLTSRQPPARRTYHLDCCRWHMRCFSLQCQGFNPKFKHLNLCLQKQSNLRMIEITTFILSFVADGTLQWPHRSLRPPLHHVSPHQPQNMHQAILTLVHIRTFILLQSHRLHAGYGLALCPVSLCW